MLPAVPLPIRETSRYAELTYDAVRAFEWKDAFRIFGELKTSAGAVATETFGDSTTVDALGETTHALEHSILDRVRPTALWESNLVTLLAANLAEAYHPLVPVDVDRLGYHARAVQIGAMEGDDALIAREGEALDRNLKSVRAVVADYVRPARLQQLDALVTELRAARADPERIRLADDVLREVGALRDEVAARRYPAQ